LTENVAGGWKAVSCEKRQAEGRLMMEREEKTETRRREQHGEFVCSWCLAAADGDDVC